MIRMSCCEPSVIIDLLKDLTCPNSAEDEDKDKGNQDAISKNNLDRLLEINLQNFIEKLGTSENLSQLFIAWKKAGDVSYQNSDPIRWRFVCSCLKLIELLQKNLTKLSRTTTGDTDQSANLSNKVNSDQSQTSKHAARALLPGSLSFVQQKVVLSAIQFIVCLGVCPNLQNGVGIPVSRRSQFANLLLEPSGSNISDIEKKSYLMICAKVLIPCIKNPSLGALILSRHLNDLLAILLQLCYGYPAESMSCARQLCVDSTIAAQDSRGQADFSSGLTPSSVVDIVICQQKNKHSCLEGDENQRISGRQQEKSVDPETLDAVKSVTHSFGGTSGDESTERTGQKEETEENDRLQLTGDAVGSRHIFMQEDTEFCERSLKTLMDQVYQPMLVRELLLLQGGAPVTMPGKSIGVDQASSVLGRSPTWLRKICGMLLSDILMKTKGIYHIVLGMLGGAAASGSTIMASQSADWRKCDAVAKVIACSPHRTASVEQYFKHVAPQILELLQNPDKKMAQQYLRIACSTISNMAARHPQLARKHLIQPLLRPLLLCTEEIDYDEEQKVIVDETCLGKCIEDIHRLYVSGPTPNLAVLSGLYPLVRVLFGLFCASKQGVSNLRTASFEIMVVILKQSEQTWSLSCLHNLAFGTSCQQKGTATLTMNSKLMFTPGPNGGTVVVTRLADSESPFLLQQEVRIPAILDLLKDLQTDGLTGEFFISLLKELTEIINIEMSVERHDTAPIEPQGQELLDLEIEENKALQNFSRKLMLLNLLAAVCEEMGPSCLTNAKHTIEFIHATLQRGVQVCEQTEDEMFGAFETETLTMAMGLLTAFLGGAMKIEQADREELSMLLPLLQKISLRHSDVHVQEMASDLRIAIATHGVIWSELLKQSSSHSMKKSKQIYKHAAKDVSSNRPKFEVLSDIPNPETLLEKSLSNTSLISHCQNEMDNLPTEIPTNDVSSELKQTSSGSVQDHKLSGSKTPNEVSEQKQLEEVFNELCDPLIPVRGHALLILVKLAKSKNSSILAKQEIILKIFEENIDHPDSYLYLPSANGLAAMADIFPDVVIPRLAHKFATLHCDKANSKGPELRMKLGESLMKATRSMGEMVVKYRDVLLAAILTGARDEDELVRASSLSNLGELCHLLRFSLAGVLHEVLNCCSNLLKFDKSVQVREAAALTITLLLQGLGKDSTTVLDTVLKDIYRVLKSVMSTEKEESVKVHANLALNELENIMKEYIFPEQTLQKRIHVLDPN